MTITEFLKARIDEDEAVARAADYTPGRPWECDGKYRCVWNGTGQSVASHTDVGNFHRDGQHIARWDPERVLAECAAKRAIIEAHPTQTYSSIVGQVVMECLTCERFPCDTLRALAAVYKDHPDYRQEWAS